MILLIDNYDSFTWNLVQYFGALGQQVVVHRHDAITLDGIEALAPDQLVISPGPGNPDQAGISMAAIRHFAGRLPILGVCLGHQAIAQAFGARVVRAAKVMHGKTSLIQHNGAGLFCGLPDPLQVTRYHSLIVDEAGLPDCLQVTARTLADDQQAGGDIMALRHRDWPLAGVQFHPESILSEQGLALLDNFVRQR